MYQMSKVPICWYLSLVEFLECKNKYSQILKSNHYNLIALYYY